MNNTLATTENGTVYEALVKRLRKSILTGEYKPGQLLGSEYGISRDEKISRMTVRKASEVLIDEGLIERRPGKGLYIRGNAVRKVQIVVGTLAWELSSQISRGAQEAGRSDGFEVHLYDANGNAASDLEVLRRLPQSGMSGAIILALHSTAFNEVLFRLKLDGFPFVLVDQRLKEINVPSVVSDNYGGGYQLGTMLLRHGHRRIAFIGDLVASTVQDRLAGLRDAMADVGVPLERSLIADLVTNEDQDRFKDWAGQIQQCTSRLMTASVPPSAVFCSCDGVAMAVYRALGQMGLKIPGDVSVVGFDGDPVTELMTPGLTTVRQSSFQMGRAAMEMLAARMENPDAVVDNKVMPVELITRASVAAPEAQQVVMN